MTPDLILWLVQFGLGRAASWQDHHNAGKGSTDRQLNDAALATLDRADAIKLQTIRNAGLDPDTITIEQIKEWLSIEPPTSTAKFNLEL